MMRRSAPRAARHQAGFILALGMLMLAALALIGTMALSTASFQNDMANNARLGQELYYSANLAMSTALERMIKDKPPRNNMTIAQPLGEPPDPYDLGYIDLDTTATKLIVSQLSSSCKAQPKDFSCVCKLSTNPSRQGDCIAYYVEVELKNGGNAPPRWGIGKYNTWYYRISATASGYQGNSASVSIYVAAVYPYIYR